VQSPQPIYLHCISSGTPFSELSTRRLFTDVAAVFLSINRFVVVEQAHRLTIDHWSTSRSSM